jgi:hypothetical protein
MIWEFLSGALIATAYVSVGVVFVLLGLLYLRVTGAGRPAGGASKSDLANMMILLQTMRDLLDQQKALARDFNKNFEKKVLVIRKVIDEIVQERERLTKMRTELAAMAETTRSDLVRIRAHASIHRKHAPHQTVRDIEEAMEPGRPVEPESRPVPERERPPAAIAPAPPPPVRTPVPAPETAPAVDEEDDEKSTVRALMKDYLSIGQEEKDPYDFEVPEKTPEAPEDPEASREAFRKLLKLGGDRPAPEGDDDDDMEADTPPADSGKARGRSNLMRGRVAEYRDAGMSVTELARELGLGKGEVRLILSIRDQQQPRKV